MDSGALALAANRFGPVESPPIIMTKGPDLLPKRGFLGLNAHEAPYLLILKEIGD